MSTREQRATRRHLAMMSRRNRVPTFVGDGPDSARERDRAALWRLRHTASVPQSDGTFALVYHPCAPVYDPLADTMTPPARVGGMLP